MIRRQFLKNISLGSTILWFPGMSKFDTNKVVEKTHILTLSFDDGFRKSSIKTAEIYDKHGLPACINVIASGHFPDFKNPDDYQVTPKGDFDLWNELQDRGHEIMPHGYKHANLREMPLENAKTLIRDCLQYFRDHLKGFQAKEAIFNFPYNASSPELESWLATQVKAFRTGGNGINSLPNTGQIRLTCTGFGPGNTESHLEEEISKLLALPSGWLIYNVHGLDGEGWGPMRAVFLDELLARLKKIESLALLPVGTALSTVY
jgi:peptidoglycan/xylan/chitin deacetylase (PgdA/CDA1 family)